MTDQSMFATPNLIVVEGLRMLHRLGRRHEIALVGFDARDRSGRPETLLAGSTATTGRRGGRCPPPR
jgi:hypothetical protein